MSLTDTLRELKRMLYGVAAPDHMQSRAERAQIEAADLEAELTRLRKRETALVGVLEKIAAACDDAFSGRTPYVAALNRIAMLFKETAILDAEPQP